MNLPEINKNLAVEIASLDLTNRFDLIKLRAMLGLTQEDFAQLVDVTRDYISMLERGKHHISKKFLDKLSNALGGDITVGTINADNHAVVQVGHGNNTTSSAPETLHLKDELTTLQSEVETLKVANTHLERRLTLLEQLVLNLTHK